MTKKNGMTMERETGTEVARVRVSTALGAFVVEASERGLRAVRPLREGKPLRAGRPPTADANEPASPGSISGRGSEAAAAHRIARSAAETLRRYAEGERVRYDGPLDVTGPDLHLAVWERLRVISFGATITYGEIAADLGMPAEARLVGAAVGANPVCVLVPCHRVVGADGSLRGFAWGLDLKRRLLAHEGSAALPLFADAARP